MSTDKAMVQIQGTLTGKRPAGESTEQTSPKKHKTSTAIIPVDSGITAGATTSAAKEALAVYREQWRSTIDVDPNFINRLSVRGELGYWRPSSRKVLTHRVIELDVKALRYAMSGTLAGALNVCYLSAGSMSQIDIDTEITAFVPVAVDVCMSALYAKLRSIHRSYGINHTRYPSAACYVKQIELPLPLALAIQEIGCFETHSLEENFLYIPTYPEGTEHEGRAASQYQVTTYLGYKPTLEQMGLPFKNIDPHLRAGSPWWTYKIENSFKTVDLVCTLPPSLYTDFSTQLRMLFITPKQAASYEADEIITHPQDQTTFGYRAKELRRGINVRAFLALSHCPDNWWTFK